MAPLCATCKICETCAAVRDIPDVVERTQIRDILRSHAQPPAHIRAKIFTLSDELARFDVKITKLQEQLDDLRSQRAAFQSHYDDFHGLLSSIRRLPSEILVDIFRFCWNVEPPTDIDDESPLLSLQRLANAPLLVVSQVCARWHSVVLGTPSLWGRIEVDSVLWSDTIGGETAMRLLQFALERGANHPITLTVTSTARESVHGPALELLARHSARWRSATIIAPFADLRHLSSLKGNLSQLESLDIHCWESPSNATFDMFQVAPSLRSLEFTGNINNFPVFSNFPFEQLNDLECHEVLTPESALFTTMMPRLSPTSTLRLQLCTADPDQGLDKSFHVPPAVSNAVLKIEVVGEFSPTDVHQMLPKIFAGLTLPSLTRLELGVSDYPPLYLPWPHIEFLSLSQRSSFYTHLTALTLYEVAITEAELLESLAILPALEALSISDHQCSLHGEHHLITNTLLAALAPPSPYLVPRLSYVDFGSMQKFDENIYLEFMRSRAYGLPRGSRFGSNLTSLLGHAHDLDLSIWEKINELCLGGYLGFAHTPP